VVVIIGVSSYMDGEELVCWSDDDISEGGIFKNTPEAVKACNASNHFQISSTGLPRRSRTWGTGPSITPQQVVVTEKWYRLYLLVFRALLH